MPLVLYLLIATHPQMPLIVRVLYAVIFAAWWLSSLSPKEQTGVPLNCGGRITYLDV